MSLTWHLLLYLLGVVFFCPRSRSPAHHLHALGWGCTRRCRFPFCDLGGEPCQFFPRSRELSREDASGSGNQSHHSHPSFPVCGHAAPYADAGALFRPPDPMSSGCSMSCMSLCCAQLLCYPELFSSFLPSYQHPSFWPELFSSGGCVSHVGSLGLHFFVHGAAPMPISGNFFDILLFSLSLVSFAGLWLYSIPHSS